MERKVLGKGLEALIPKRPQEELGKEFTYLPVTRIKQGRFQPRQEIDRKELEELTRSVKEKGFIQPIVVRKRADGEYEVVAGARRLEAAKSLGINEIPTLIKQIDDRESFMLAIAENLQRKDLNPVEEALAFKRLMEEFKLTLEEVGSFLGKDKSSVANTIRLLKLPSDIQQGLKSGIISRSQARTILSLSDTQEQQKLFHRMIQEGLSVRELEVTVKRVSTKRKRTSDPFVVDMEERMQKLLGTKVKIYNKRNNKGRIVIDYYSLQDLERIIKRIL